MVAYLLLELSMWLVAAVFNRATPESIPTRASLLARQTEWLEWLVEDARREEIDPLLGWRYRPSFALGPDTLNARGHRAAREYADAADEPRIAAFGDSFVYCTEVTNADCWTSLIESGWAAEVPNLGVGGYGTDQAFLRYLSEGRTLGADVVVIGFAPVDLRRIVNRYRRFVSHDEGPWFKPRFRLVGSELELVETPVGSEEDARRLIADPLLVRRFGEGDAWYEPAVYESWVYPLSPSYRVFTYLRTRLRRRYSPDLALLEEGVFRSETEAFRLQVAVVEAFADSVRADGARPLVLMLPSLEDVAGAAAGHPTTYGPLADALRARSLEVFDPIASMAGRGGDVSDMFAPGRHYSAAGNRVVAEAVAARLGLVPR